MIGYKIVGKGPNYVLVLHDWFSDSKNYKKLINCLNKEKNTFIFVDLRGYGLSKSIKGSYTLDEATNDVLELMKRFKVEHFDLIGHSMSGLIVQNIALKSNKIRKVICITPVVAEGAKIPKEAMPFVEEAINENEQNTLIMLQGMTNNEYPKEILKEKIRNWYECSTAEARLGYLKMYSDSNISKEVKGLENSFLVISGKKDSPFYNTKILKNSFSNLYENVQYLELSSTHYPMNDLPQILASEIEDFLN